MIARIGILVAALVASIAAAPASAFAQAETSGLSIGQGALGFSPSWIRFAERLKLSHDGSMWTWGATFYF